MRSAGPRATYEARLSQRAATAEAAAGIRERAERTVAAEARRAEDQLAPIGRRAERDRDYGRHRPPISHAAWHMLSRKPAVRSQRRRLSSGG
jgi:hypothetical protein